MCAEPDISPTFPENRWRTVKIRVIGPGAIELTVGDATVRFDRHSYESIDESRTISELVPAKYSESIATVCTAPTQFNFGLWLGHSVVGYSPELLKEHSSVLWEEALAVARGAATQTVAALIRDIRAGMHGGTIVFVDDPDEGESPIAQLDVIDAYRLQEWNSPMKPDPWNCGLLDYVGWRTHRELARRGITVLSDLGTSGQDLRKWADSVGWIRVKLAAELWEADTHATARLASTDGAVILDQRFRPLAFGCKFGSVNSGSHQDSNTENSLLGKGMRHRSAAAVVARDPNAMALVISQDGSVTAFRHDGDAVRARRVSI